MAPFDLENEMATTLGSKSEILVSKYAAAKDTYDETLGSGTGTLQGHDRLRAIEKCLQSYQEAVEAERQYITTGSSGPNQSIIDKSVKNAKRAFERSANSFFVQSLTWATRLCGDATKAAVHCVAAENEGDRGTFWQIYDSMEQTEQLINKLSVIFEPYDGRPSTYAPGFALEREIFKTAKERWNKSRAGLQDNKA